MNSISSLFSCSSSSKVSWIRWAQITTSCVLNSNSRRTYSHSVFFFISHNAITLDTKECNQVFIYSYLQIGCELWKITPNVVDAIESSCVLTKDSLVSLCWMMSSEQEMKEFGQSESNFSILKVSNYSNWRVFTTFITRKWTRLCHQHSSLLINGKCNAITTVQWIFDKCLYKLSLFFVSFESIQFTNFRSLHLANNYLNCIFTFAIHFCALISIFLTKNCSLISAKNRRKLFRENPQSFKIYQRKKFAIFHSWKRSKLPLSWMNFSFRMRKKIGKNW